MKHIFATIATFFCLTMYGQTFMNVHESNSSVVQILLSDIDSVTFTTNPLPAQMNIYKSNGSIQSIVVNNIDSITYSGTPIGNLATLTTTTLSSITAIGASSGGNISNDGGSSIIARGVCWSISPNPTTANNKTVDANGIGILPVF